MCLAICHIHQCHPWRGRAAEPNVYDILYTLNIEFIGVDLKRVVLRRKGLCFVQAWLGRDTAQRMIMPVEGGADMVRLHTVRTYCLLLVGCPPCLEGTRFSGIQTKDMMRFLATTLRCGAATSWVLV